VIIAEGKGTDNSDKSCETVRTGENVELKLGEKQTLVIVKKVEFGVYLATKEAPEDKVLLPAKQVPAGANVGDEVEVFLYRDSSDRLIATIRTPKLIMGQVALLTVVQIGKVGAFLDWGLEKDLFLPFKQQTRKVKAGDQVLASLYIDKSGRLCATMNVYEQLRTDSPYKKDDMVTGRIYEISKNFGAFVAVDDCFSALIPKKELFGATEPPKIGEQVTARVVKVLEDGKLTLSIREKAYLQIQKDAEKIEKLLDSYEGSLPFNDKAAPEVITHETGMSKNEFKRAVGHLLKEGKIQITEKNIRRI
jgi:hypothetical protein